jgi:UDP-N-acetyl-D-mannosaminuronic acid dehydrogenase
MPLPKSQRPLRMLSDSNLNVVVLGLGYIGLPTAAIIAGTGAQVLGVDVTESVVETVNSGRMHIEEVDLDGLVSGVVARGTLRASTTITHPTPATYSTPRRPSRAC